MAVPAFFWTGITGSFFHSTISVAVKDPEKIRKMIGRVEQIDFPEFDIRDIDAKIDTGAYTSAVHCHAVSCFVDEQTGTEMVSFRLLDPSHPAYNNREIVLPVKARRKIRNSFGQVQKRIIVETKMRIFGKLYRLELSLADRSKQEYPVLLGRKALYKRFIVDVSQKNLSSKARKKAESDSPSTHDPSRNS
jgi:hypothetical protein